MNANWLGKVTDSTRRREFHVGEFFENCCHNIEELVENDAILNACSAFIGPQNGKAGFSGDE